MYENIGQTVSIESGIELTPKKYQELDIYAPFNNHISTLDVIKSWWYVTFCRNNLIELSGVFILSCAHTVIGFVIPTFLAKSISDLSNTSNNTSFEKSIGLLVIASAINPFLTNLKSQLVTRLTGRNIHTLTTQSVEHLLKKGLDFHFHNGPDRQHIIVEKALSIANITTPLFNDVIPILIEAVIASVYMSYEYDQVIGLSLVGLFLSYMIYLFSVANYVISANQEFLRFERDVSHFALVTAILNYKLMRDFNQHDYTMDYLNGTFEKCWNNIWIKSINRPIHVNYGSNILSYGYMLGIAFYIGKKVQDDEYNVDDFIIIIGYLSQLASLFPSFANGITTFFSTFPDLKFFFGELQQPLDIERVDNHSNVPFPHKEHPPMIEFQNVYFHHRARRGEEETRQLFQDLSFKIQPGKCTALLGSNAIGKSTLFHLVSRYYLPQKGQILINGKNISEISLTALQKQIIVIENNPHIFMGTLRQNIIYGASNPYEVTDEQIWGISEKANLKSFLASFEHGLDTFIGNMGTTLSDGQKQKIAVIRGLMKNGSILLFDEITSSMDNTASNEILSSINEGFKNTTRFMISHKLHEVKNYADEIIVIDKGKVFQGTHLELLGICPLYQTLSKYEKGYDEERPSHQSHSL